MKLNKEYLISTFILIAIISFLFNKMLLGNYIFTSGDTLSPIAIKNAILNYSTEYNSFPTWFPWIFAGMPTIHSLMSVSSYYLPHYLMLLLNNIGIPWFWYFIFHLTFGGLGMYSLLKYFKLDRYSSIFGGILYAIMPYMITMTVYGHGSQMMTACYIPWIMLYLFRIYDSDKFLDYTFLSLLISLQLLRAHIQISYYTWMMVGLFILVSSFYLLKEKKINIYQFAKLKLKIIFSLILGAIISLSLYLPVINYSAMSTRGAVNGGVGIDYATQWSMSIKEIVTLIFPYSMGFGGKFYFGDFPFTDYPNYIGLFVVSLSFIGFVKSNLNIKYKFYFLLTILFSVLISLGSNFIQFYNFFYNYFPFFNKFRVPSYILIITNFSLIFLAAFGFNVLVSSIKNKVSKNRDIYYILLVPLILSTIYILKGVLLIPKDVLNRNTQSALILNDGYFLFIAIFIFIIIYLLFNYKKYNKKLLSIMLISILCFDYYRIDNEIINPSNHIPHKKIIKNKNYINNYLLKDEVTDYLLQDNSKFRLIDYVGDQNRWTIHNIENINGYYPAKINNYDLFVKNINKKGYQIWPEGILKLLNIKYLILPGELIQHELFNNLGSKEMYYFGHYEDYNGKPININLYKYNNYSDRMFYTNAIKQSNNKDIYNNIMLDDYDPYRIVYTDNQYVADENFINNDRYIDIIDWKADEIRFRTNTRSKQFLVISEMYYKDGWEVTKNGEYSQIYKVNNLVRGLEIPEGHNEFVMIFKPTDLKLGKIILIFGYLLIVLIIFCYYRIESRYEKI